MGLKSWSEDKPMREGTITLRDDGSYQIDYSDGTAKESAAYDPVLAENLKVQKRRDAYLRSGDPDPQWFDVTMTFHINGSTLARVTYPSCRNHDGRKILFWNKIVQPRELKELDPHFTDDANAPFARFEPTDDGWKAAIMLAQALYDSREHECG